ncbi:response regulator transcription factor [uncultured Clostridium sp.]|uniref:response regulator transcription factor n=1 Tax=uncultured Clostridium sp. TaxID=59620 RepID=UPI0025CEF8E5|nr:response regulator transcription factor [uncultured Clostridium sp.]
MINLLIVEDDKNLRRLMEVFFKKNGFEVFLAENGEKAFEIFDKSHIDLVLCDIMIPKVNGYDLVKELRRFNYDLPIIMVTAKENFEDKKKGFLVGVDDYMVKPIDLDELLLRVNALLRRAKISNEHKLIIGSVVLNYDTLTVTKEDNIIELTKKEFYLLFKLLSYPKQIFTRRQLMEEIWGIDIESDERTVDVHIKRIREKLSKFDEFKIITVRGLGYKAEKML